jgi:hypothetical protein
VRRNAGKYDWTNSNLTPMLWPCRWSCRRCSSSAQFWSDTIPVSWMHLKRSSFPDTRLANGVRGQFRHRWSARRYHGRKMADQRGRRGRSHLHLTFVFGGLLQYCLGYVCVIVSRFIIGFASGSVPYSSRSIWVNSRHRWCGF